MEFSFSFIPAGLFFVIILIAGIAVNNERADLCEHNGLGKWHSFTQVCEPVKP